MLSFFNSPRSIFNKLNFIFSYSRSRKIILLFILIVMSVFLETLSISFVLPTVSVLLDPTFSSDYVNFIYNLFPELKTKNLTVYFITGLLIIFAIKNLIYAYLVYKKADLITYFNLSLSSLLYSKYMNLNYKFLSNIETSKILRNISNEVSLTVSSVNQLLTLILEVSVLISIFIFLCFVNFSITILTFSLIAFFLLIFLNYTNKKTSSWGDIRQKNEANRIKSIQDTFGGIKEIKIYNLENSAYQEFYNYNQALTNSAKFIQIITQYPRLWLEFLVVLSVSLIIIYLSLFNYSSTYIISLLAMFGVAILRVMPSANRLSMTLISIKYALPAINKIYQELKNIEYISSTTDDSIEENKNNIIQFKNSIQFKKINFRYLNQKKNSIINTNITINSGDCVGIEGPNGSGKSTFVNILSGLFEPTEGEILIDNNKRKLNHFSWRNKIGYVTQNPYFLSDTIKKNIIFGNTYNKEKLFNILNFAELSNFKNEFENGLETKIGEQGIKISGGQKKKIAIARALYREPEILIFDEATTALDATSTENFYKTVKSLKHKTKVIVIISHENKIFNLCNKILNFNNGNIKQVKNNSFEK